MKREKFLAFALVLVTERSTVGDVKKLLVKELASDDRLVEDTFFIQYFQPSMTKDCFVSYRIVES